MPVLLYSLHSPTFSDSFSNRSFVSINPPPPAPLACHRKRSFILHCSSSLTVSGMDGSSGLGLYPLHRSKTIHLVRHAQGIHNVEGEKNYNNYFSEELFDAHLTPLGWQQVDNLHKHVQERGLNKKIELVITSPLLRTIQTAVGVFGGKGYTDGVNVPPLMVASAGKSNRPAVSSFNCPPFVAVELCREHLVYLITSINRKRKLCDFLTEFLEIEKGRSMVLVEFKSGNFLLLSHYKCSSVLVNVYTFPPYFQILASPL